MERDIPSGATPKRLRFIRVNSKYTNFVPNNSILLQLHIVNSNVLASFYKSIERTFDKFQFWTVFCLEHMFELLDLFFEICAF